MYFDNNATTPLYPEVVETIRKSLSTQYGNPSSSYAIGRSAYRDISNARNSIAKILGIRSPENQLVFCSGATEGNNTIIRGLICNNNKQKNWVVSTPIEHASVHKTLKQLEEKGYCNIYWLPINRHGIVETDSFRQAVKKFKPVLACIILGNNEIGSIQDNMHELVALSHKYGTHLHVDCTQMIGKYPINLEKTGFDSAVFSAHKWGGPKGIGGIYVRDNSKIVWTMTGGQQEFNCRAGTENTAFIEGMAEALSISMSGINTKMKQVQRMRDSIQHILVEKFPHAVVNGNSPLRLYNTLSISFPSVNSRAVTKRLGKQGIYMNVGSACSKDKRSRILEAIGLSKDLENGTLRISLSHRNTICECKRLTEYLARILEKCSSKKMKST